MKVAHIAGKFPNPSETFILNQIAGLLDAGHEVDIYAHYKPDTEIQQPIIQEYDLIERTTYTRPPFGVISGTKRVVSSTLRNQGRRRDILAALRRGLHARNKISFLDTIPDEYDLYHVHFGWVLEDVDFISDLFDAPLIVSFYGNDVGEVLKDNPDRYDDLWPKVDAITVLSYDMKEKVVNAGASEKKITINPLSIDSSEFSYSPTNSPESSEELKIATVGRLVEKKGLRYAIRGVSRAANDIDIEYKIAGGGGMEEELKSIIADEGVSDSVELLGWVDQSTVSELLEECHIFLLPSHTAPNGDREGTPTALLEAQACGLPVISTYHAGIPEIVEHRERGYLCPVMDSEAISDAIEELYKRRSNWNKMGKKGNEYVESHHSRQAQTKRLEEIYRNVRYLP